MVEDTPMTDTDSVAARVIREYAKQIRSMNAELTNAYDWWYQYQEAAGYWMERAEKAEATSARRNGRLWKAEAQYRGLIANGRLNPRAWHERHDQDQ